MTDRLVQADNVISRRIGDEIVLIKDDGKATHVLNKTAAAIWELCDGQLGLDEIAARLCERFEVAFDEARADTAEFIDKMARAGILNHCGEAAGSGECQHL